MYRLGQIYWYRSTKINPTVLILIKENCLFKIVLSLFTFSLLYCDIPLACRYTCDNCF